MLNECICVVFYTVFCGLCVCCTKIGILIFECNACVQNLNKTHVKSCNSILFWKLFCQNLQFILYIRKTWFICKFVHYKRIWSWKILKKQFRFLLCTVNVFAKKANTKLTQCQDYRLEVCQCEVLCSEFVSEVSEISCTSVLCLSVN